jgi:hypothetical protein
MGYLAGYTDPNGRSRDKGRPAPVGDVRRDKFRAIGRQTRYVSRFPSVRAIRDLRAVGVSPGACRVRGAVNHGPNPLHIRQTRSEQYDRGSIGKRPAGSKAERRVVVAPQLEIRQTVLPLIVYRLATWGICENSAGESSAIRFRIEPFRCFVRCTGRG